MFLARVIPAFVMYCVNGASRSSLLRVYRLYDIYIRYAPKKPSRCRLIIFRYPFWIRSRSVRIFRPFWICFNLFPCCAICFSAWQFMILIKVRARMLLTGRMVFSDYTKKRILYYHAKRLARTLTSHTRTLTARAC